MTGALLYVYLGGWLVASVGVAVAARRLQDEREPAAHPGFLSIMAGAAWPVLLIALAETALVAITQDVIHTEEPMLSVVA